MVRAASGRPPPRPRSERVSAPRCRSRRRSGASDSSTAAARARAGTRRRRHPREHARAQALLEAACGRPVHRLDQPELGSLRHDRHRVEQAAAAAREARRPREHRVADAAGMCSRSAASASVTKNGCRWSPVELLRVHAAGSASVATAACDSASSSTRVIASVGSSPSTTRSGCARRPAPRVGDDSSAATPSTRGREPHHVQRRLVGPLQVLEDDDAGGRLEFAQQRVGHVVRLRAALDALRQLSVDDARDVEQRPERARCEQRIAARPQDAGRGTEAVAEAAQQRGLADPRLAMDQDGAASGRGRHRSELVLQRESCSERSRSPAESSADEARIVCTRASSRALGASTTCSVRMMMLR